MRGIHGLEHLAKALNLSSADNVAHMIVLTSKIGKRAQVSAHGLLERSLALQGRQIDVKGRIFEHTNTVSFSLTRQVRIILRDEAWPETHPQAEYLQLLRSSLKLVVCLAAQVRQAPLLHTRRFPSEQERLDSDRERDGHHPIDLAAHGLDTGGRRSLSLHVRQGDRVASRMLLTKAILL